MKFSELLIDAIRRSEIPLRFEPGAEESVAKPVTELLRAWIESHSPGGAPSDFEKGEQALILQLLAELSDAADLPD